MRLQNSLLLIACVAVVGCRNEPADRQYVARVGDATLTEKEITLAVGVNAEPARRQYVSAWVTQQLLFQEARRRKFTESPEVLAQLEEAKQQLASNAFLQEEVYGDSAAVTDEAVAQEFAARRDQYRVNEDVVRMSFAIFDERDPANAFRSRILRGASWDASVQQLQGDDEAKNHLLRIETDKYFSREMVYPEELWKVARALSKEDISYVVKTNAGYCVVLVSETIKQGELPTLAYAKDEIRKRLEVAQRTAKYNELLAELRAKADVDIRLGSVDTLAQTPHE